MGAARPKYHRPLDTNRMWAMRTLKATRFVGHAFNAAAHQMVDRVKARLNEKITTAAQIQSRGTRSTRPSTASSAAHPTSAAHWSRMVGQNAPPKNASYAE